MSHSHLPGQQLGSNHPLDFPFPRFTSAGTVLKSTIKLFKDNPALINKVVFGFYLPPVLALSLLSFLTDSPLVSALQGILFWLVFPLIEAALIYGTVVYLRTGANPPLSECFRWGIKKWWPIFAVSFLTGLYIGLGTLCFIIPGIILAVRYSLVVPVTAVEDVGVDQAMKRSSALTQGYRWRIFGTLFIAWLTTTAISWLATGRSAGPGAHPFMTPLLIALTNALLQGAYTIIETVIYLGIRADRDGTTSDTAVLQPIFEIER